MGVRASSFLSRWCDHLVGRFGVYLSSGGYHGMDDDDADDVDVERIADDDVIEKIDDVGKDETDLPWRVAWYLYQRVLLLPVLVLLVPRSCKFVHLGSIYNFSYLG